MKGKAWHASLCPYSANRSEAGMDLQNKNMTSKCLTFAMLLAWSPTTIDKTEDLCAWMRLVLNLSRVMTVRNALAYFKTR